MQEDLDCQVLLHELLWLQAGKALGLSGRIWPPEIGSRQVGWLRNGDLAVVKRKRAAEVETPETAFGQASHTRKLNRTLQV